MPLRDFFNLVLVCNNGPRQGRTKNKVFLCTVITFSLTLYLLSFKTIINKVLRIPVILEGLRPKFLDSKNRVREKVITVPKKTLLLVLPYLGPLSLQTRTKLKKSLKGILNCCKLQILFKSQNKSAKAFRFEDRIPKDLHLVSSINFSVGSAINPIMVNA